MCFSVTIIIKVLLFHLELLPLAFLGGLVWWWLLLQLCFSGKLLISSVVLGLQFFPFSTLNVFTHALLTCEVSSENLLRVLWGIPLVTSCFSLAPLKSLSWSLIFDSLIVMCLIVGLFRFFCFWTLLGFLDLGVCFFSPGYGRFQPLFLWISFLPLSLFFWEPCSAYICPFYGVPKAHWTTFTCLLLFSLCSSIR